MNEEEKKQNKSASVRVTVRLLLAEFTKFQSFGDVEEYTKK